MPETIKTRRPRPGRPIKSGAKADKPGLGSILSARISFDVRSALEAEADRTGRSISQVADRWLDAARAGHASFLDMIGGDAEVGAAINKLVEIARAVRASCPDREMFPTALYAAWAAALVSVTHRGIVTEELRDELAELSAAWEACEEVVRVLANATEDDPVAARAMQPLRLAPTGLLGRGRESKLFLVLLKPDPRNPFAAGMRPDETVLNALNELCRAGDTAKHEIGTALDRVQICVARAARQQLKFEQALALGREVGAKAVRVEAPKRENGQ